MRRLLPIFVLALVSTPSWGAARTPASADAESLNVLRRAFGEGRWSDASLPGLAERLVARWQAKGVPPESLAVAYEWLGRLRLLRVENRAADSAFALAESAQRAARRPDPGALARVVAWRAEGLRANRQLAGADSTAAAALALLERARHRDPTVELRALQTRGNALAARGRAAEAVADLARGVTIAEAMQPPDSLGLGQAVRNLARARTTGGDLVGARADFARALAIQERALGEHAEVATTCYMASGTALQLGDFVSARKLAERALAIRTRVFGPNHLVVGVVESALGATLREIGDPQGALVHYERAVAIQRALATPSPFELQLALNNLGGARLDVGDGAGARACLEEARDVRVRVFGPPAAHSLWSSVRLADALLLEGDLVAARARVDSIFASLDPARVAGQRFELSDAFRVRAQIAWRRGQRSEALADFERAHAREDSVLGPGSPRTLGLLSWVALAREGTGDRAGAWAAAEQIERESRDVMRLGARSLSEREALGFERTLLVGQGLLHLLADSPPGSAPEARARLADAVVRSRLLVLDQLAEERLSLPSDAEGLGSAVRELELARDTLARTLVLALRTDRLPDEQAARAGARRDAAERVLAERSERFASELRRANAGYAEVVAALPTGSALVSLSRTEDPRLDLMNEWPGDSVRHAARRYVALVTRAGESAPVRVDLGPAPPLESAIARWLDACATPPPATRALAAAAERRCTALGRRVRDLAWAPLEPSLAGVARVFVVPDGALLAVNLLALPDPRGGVLAERGPTVHRLTAERDLLPWAEARGTGLLAMGGADFDDAGAADAAPDGVLAMRATGADSLRFRFAPLPHTADEVADIASLWRASRATDAASVETPVGAEASEESFKRLAPGRRVLHVATHGFALGGEARTAPAGTRAMGVATGRAEGSGGLPRAGLLPGLALAGANAVAGEGRDDGYLTAEEITSLDLRGNEWAVLSACETGLADPAAIEPVQGLPRAFRRAGTRTVVMSLWAVDDESTRAWMARLYHARLADGLDTAESVRAACRDVLRERRARGLDTHPFHWAAFVASGDWR